MIVKIYRTATFLFILAILSVIAYFMNSIIELLIMLTCFLASKQKYKFKYHCKSAFHCLILSVSVFTIAARLTFPIGVSYACSGICGLLIAYIAQYEAESKFIRKDYAYIEPKYNALALKDRERDIYTMSEERLRELCREHLLDDIDEEIVVQRLIYRRKGQDLYRKIGYSKTQMIRREKRIESKLNIRLKDR